MCGGRMTSPRNSSRSASLQNGSQPPADHKLHVTMIEVVRQGLVRPLVVVPPLVETTKQEIGSLRLGAETHVLVMHRMPSVVLIDSVLQLALPETLMRALLARAGGTGVTRTVLGARRIVAIGDSLKHDVAGGTEAGFDTAFVMNGIHWSDFADCAGDEIRLGRLVSLAVEEDVMPDWVVPWLSW
jgi:hypothetical protein